MATQTINYAADAQLTITLASLATSPMFVIGAESSVVDNTTNKYVDALLSGKITVGTTITINTQILVYIFTPINDTPTYPDVMNGTASTVTLTSAGVGRGFLHLIATLDVDSTTNDRTYPFGQRSVAQLFGGVLPPRWSVFVTHNTGNNLNATGSNHEISYQGIKYDVA